MVFVLILLSTIFSISSFNIRDLFPVDYDISELPPAIPPETRTEIKVSCLIKSITEIDTETLSYSLEWILILYWKEQRIISNNRTNYVIGRNELADIIWTPMIYVVNDKETRVSTITDENVFFTISPNNFIFKTISSLSISFHFKRKILSFAIQTYFSSVLLVIVSWATFWLGTEAVEARIQLGITTILTTITSIVASIWRVPSVSTKMKLVGYLKSIDIWNVGTISFVSAAFFETPTAYWLAKRNKEGAVTVITKRNQEVECLKEREKIYRSLDRICRFVFPAAYVSFISIYLMSYVL